MKSDKMQRERKDRPTERYERKENENKNISDKQKEERARKRSGRETGEKNKQ